MEKYLIVVYASYSTDAAPKKALYTTENEADAVRYFHSYMANYMADGNVKHLLVTALGIDGEVLRSESFDR